MAKRSPLVGTILLAGIVTTLTACDGSTPDAANGGSESGTVTVFGVVIGEQQEKLEQALAPFEEETGIDVVYEGTDAFATLLPVRVDSGNAPDIAMFPQPGLMRDFAREGRWFPSTHLWIWAPCKTPIPRIGLIWPPWRAALRCLVSGVGEKPGVVQPQPPSKPPVTKSPTTWDEMMALTDHCRRWRNPLVPGHGKRRCHRLGGHRLGGRHHAAHRWPEVYDQWINHEIPFNAPEVQAAFERFGEIALNPDYVVGGTVGVLSTPFGDSPNPLFEEPPGCYLHRQANFHCLLLPRR
jgi:alpha-glucoside transport system substrate-binding protein